MLIRKCDRCGKIIEENNGLAGIADAIMQTILNLREMTGQKNGRNIELYKVRGDAMSRIDLCECCRISFRKWYEGEHADDVQEQDTEGSAEEDSGQQV